MTTGMELATVERLLVAVALGGVIGLERQLHGRPAGLRTHILVCLGAALVMILSSSFGDQVDPGRAVAGIVTGVGFLGAGVIVKSKELVRGLTTAACVWFVAALGVVIGQGLYVVAAIGTALGVAILTLFDAIAHLLPSVTYHMITVEGEVAAADGIEDAARRILGRLGFRVVTASCAFDVTADVVSLTLRLRSRHAVPGLSPSRDLLAISGVRRVSWD